MSKGLGIGAGVLETVGNVAMAEHQYQQELELMNIQHQNQQQLNQQGHDLQYEMWKKTNYPAQIRMMEKAGLNPALMYKGAGPGGTTGSQGGGAAAKGSAPQRPQMNMRTMLMGLEMKALEAGIENQKAQTDKAKQEANLTKEKAVNEAGGIRGKLAGEIGKIDNEIKLIDSQIDKLSKESQLLIGQYDKLLADTKFVEQATKTEVQKTEVERYNKVLAKLNKEWQEKWELNPNDSAIVKTMLRTEGYLANKFDIDWEENIENALIAMKKYDMLQEKKKNQENDDPMNVKGGKGE